MGAVAHHAGQKWEKMDGVQREPYVQQAQAANNGTNSVGKLNSLGIPIALLDEKIREKERMALQIKQLIAERVKIAEAVKALEKEEFYIISMMYFGCTLKGAYLPAELGMVKYSLQDGVMDRKHLYINIYPDIPLGAAYSVHSHTKKTHKLPMPPDAWGISCKDEISNIILSFIAAKENNILLFTDELTLPTVESMLREILKGHIKDDQMYVCPLSELFFNLKQASERHIMPKSTFPSALMAQYILQMDCFVATEGISCEFHDSEYNVQHCALSQATRWAYTLSKHCCLDMGIDCIPGKHIPSITKVKVQPDKSGTDATSATLPKPFETSLKQAEEPSSSTAKSPTIAFTSVAPERTVSLEKYNRSFDEIKAATREQVEQMCNRTETPSSSTTGQPIPPISYNNRMINPSSDPKIVVKQKKLEDICTDAKSEFVKCVTTLINNVQELVLADNAPSDQPQKDDVSSNA
ncbi:protein maelstrom homolog [Anopheles marshallii]|uniref:protein maelstrom homolog n=1 Tax=Anopheles marshallii TaxID=1521116 RepID=UPI00237BF1FD|nr:protein maelstrom homolog [Anopheles marshallii]